MAMDIKQINGLVEEKSEFVRRLFSEMEKVIVGQQSVIDELMIAIFARGHCLLVGVPGLAKTLLVSTLSRCLSLSLLSAGLSRVRV